MEPLLCFIYTTNYYTKSFVSPIFFINNLGRWRHFAATTHLLVPRSILSFLNFPCACTLNAGTGTGTQYQRTGTILWEKISNSKFSLNKSGFLRFETPKRSA